MSRNDFDGLTPAETRALRREVDVLLKGEDELKLAHTKGLMGAIMKAGGRG